WSGPDRSSRVSRAVARAGARGKENRMHRYAMTYDPRTGNPFARIVERWLQSPLSEDPLEAVVQMLRTEASYHREFANAGAAKAFEHAASYVEMAIAAIRDAEVDYELAARIS